MQKKNLNFSVSLMQYVIPITLKVLIMARAIIKSLMRGLKKGSIRFAYFYDDSFSSMKIWLKSTVVRDFGSPGMVPLWTE